MENQQSAVSWYHHGRVVSCFSTFIFVYVELYYADLIYIYYVDSLLCIKHAAMIEEIMG